MHKAIKVGLIVLILWPALQSTVSFAQEIMFCGNSTRVGADLYDGSYTEVLGCTPNAGTAALLVTRSGAPIAGSGATWLSFLNEGGTIITEFQPEPIYNEIYGTSYSTDFIGDCVDQIAPTTILNPGDAFWLANPGATTPTDDSCGSDLQDIVDGEAGNVVALGARDDGSVSLAYRSVGSGVLYLVAADWADLDVTGADFANSRQLIDYMITHQGAPAAPATPVPVLPLEALWILGGLAGLLGMRQLSKAA